MPEVLRVNDVIADKIVAHHVSVLRLAKGADSRVQRMLGELDRETFRIFNQRANSEGVVSNSRVDQVLAAVLRANNRTYKAVSEFLHAELREVAHHEVEVNDAITSEALPFRYRMSRPAKAYTSALVDEVPMSGGLLSEWIGGLAAGRYQRVRAQIRLSSASHENVSDLIKRVRGTKALNFRDGVSNVNARSAKTMVNTVYNSVVNRARVDFYRFNPDIILGWQWSAILDDRTCIRCAELNGEVFDSDEVEESPVPSLHPGCRCLMTPILSSPDEEAYEFPPPHKLKYDDWLANQKASLQDEILGPARAAMFRRGMPIKKFIDASGIKYNLTELRQREASDMAKSTKKLPDVKVLHKWGWNPDIGDARDMLFSVAQPKPIALPTKVSLREIMPPVVDQGELGSCVSCACIASHMAVHKGDQPLSRLALYWSARFIEGTVDEDSGVMIRDGVKALAKWGVCEERTWPYLIRKFRVDPPAKADKEGLKHRIRSYQRLNSMDDYMKCLAQGYTFVFGMSVYDNIFETMTTKKGILLAPSPKAKVLGGHALCVVGYDQNFWSNPVFKASGLSTEQCPNFMMEVRNSWGPDWAIGGYFYMDATMLIDRNISDDFWTIRD